MPEQPEDPEILAAAAILMSMHRVQGAELGGDSRVTVTAAPRGGYHSATNNAAGGSFALPSLREQEDRKMMDGSEKSLNGNNRAASSGVLEGRKPGEVYRPQPQPLTYYIPTDYVRREQRPNPRFVDFNSAKSNLDADEAHRLAVWRHNSSLGVAGFDPGTPGRGYTIDYDNHMFAQDVAYADQNGEHQIPFGIPMEQSNMWFADQSRTQESSFLHNNRDQEPNPEHEGRTRN
ncbi:hypothetical protein KC340_g2484 [Hortaea werneckii]|nr:hypothetical protein KC342_g2286 [Hortaea werneckii]KAI7104889.1 hypothetical protein KC339_g4213 [Hortaea werneckii]KAI7235353.1 hypothetical protein KC365_g5601 [Hortaea werneckii]KAI7334432.1 hypothetical protein KC340_g2484 [Hortaea werneckii]KAI7406512.1 hypothetical protein KC328_g928 [Hortaea werneckii]